MPEPTPLDVVRSRFPRTPDADAPALRAHAGHLARLRDRLPEDGLRGTEPATTFDPRGTDPHA
ncbi:hypothetical protein [Brachybacterium tyrofermentans]|uniref:Uncharacterized protein n=1 Tax=Brachybacterium tyrofermentans TaxID=47848 RepID=A0ABW0FKA9_9MICO